MPLLPPLIPARHGPASVVLFGSTNQNVPINKQHIRRQRLSISNAAPFIGPYLVRIGFLQVASATPKVQVHRRKEHGHRAVSACS
jgi:hypothetical protein